MKEKNGNNLLQKIFKEFGVKDMYELDRSNLEYDQKVIKENLFDENDPDLLNNRIKDRLLDIDLNELEKYERQIIQGILWLWYHHATTVAIWRDKDLSKARSLCKKAIDNLYPEHPNKITPMIHLLLHGKIEEARRWKEEEVEEVEKEYALYLLEEYEKGTFKEIAYK